MLRISPAINQVNTAKSQCSFTGYQDFLNNMAKSDLPANEVDMKSRVAASLPSLFENMSTKDALMIFNAIQQNNSASAQDGFSKFLTDASKEISPEKRVAFINSLQEGLASTRKITQLGTIERKDGKVIVTSYDNAEGKASTTVFDESKRQNKIFGPETNVKTFLREAFGNEPKLKICPVGWTVPNTDILYETNDSFKKLIDETEDKLLERMSKDRGSEVKKDDPEFAAKFTKAKKQIAAKLYEDAFKEFWEPIDKELFGGQDSKFNRDQLAFITSGSYSGIDKAAIDYASENQIPVANITPFTYAGWSDNGDKSPYPLLVTNTVDDYADACAEAADLLIVTGGRDHSYQKDLNNFMIGKNKFVIPVDVMKEIFAFEIPATSRGQVANAAALMIQKGMDVSNLPISVNIVDSPNLTKTQKAVAAAIKTLLKQRTHIDPNKIVDSVQGK